MKVLKTPYSSNIKFSFDLNSGLLFFTFIYINLATSLFFYFWLTKPLSILVTLIFVAYATYQLLSLSGIKLRHKLTLGDVLKVLTLAIFITWISGASGIGGTPAFDTRHQIQKIWDFSTLKSPIYYPQVQSYASYYFGFYIVPGLLNKLIGSIFWVTFGWEVIGLTLGLLWIYLFLNKSFLKLSLIFLLSGLLSFIIPFIRLENIFLAPYFYFEETNWSILPLYLSFKWIPNQFIYLSILVGMVFYLPGKSLLKISTLVLSGLFWAPFPTVVIGILYIIKIFPAFSRLTLRNRALFLLINLIPFILLILYLISNNTSTAVEFQIISWKKALKYLISMFFEIGVFYWLINKKYKKSILLNTTLIMALALALFRLGFSNDLFVKGVQPILLILYMYFINSLEFRKTKLNLIRISIFLLSSLIPLKYMYLGVSDTSLETNCCPYTEFNTFSLLEFDYDNEIAKQYLMKKDSFFYKNLLDKTEEETLLKIPNEIILSRFYPSRKP